MSVFSIETKEQLSTGFWVNQLFIPGRVCLFGEHSDWTGSYRSENPDLEKGHAIVVPTTQGLYAETKPHTERLILHSCGTNDEDLGTIDIPMDLKALQLEMEKDHFFQYQDTEPKKICIYTEIIRRNPIFLKLITLIIYVPCRSS